MAKILVVDDDLSIHVAVSKALSGDGHVTRTAFTGEEGLARFSTEKFDLLITDLAMPKLDGLGMLTRLRERGALDGLPFMLIAGPNERETYRIAQEVGAVDIVTKPIDTKELLLRVRRALDRRKAPVGQKVPGASQTGGLTPPTRDGGAAAEPPSPPPPQRLLAETGHTRRYTPPPRSDAPAPQPEPGLAPAPLSSWSSLSAQAQQASATEFGVPGGGYGGSSVREPRHPGGPASGSPDQTRPAPRQELASEFRLMAEPPSLPAPPRSSLGWGLDSGATVLSSPPAPGGTDEWFSPAPSAACAPAPPIPGGPSLDSPAPQSLSHARPMSFGGPSSPAAPRTPVPGSPPPPPMQQPMPGSMSQQMGFPQGFGPSEETIRRKAVRGTGSLAQAYATPAQAERPDCVGQIGAIAVAELVRFMFLGKKSGVLEITSQDYRGEMAFTQGELMKVVTYFEEKEMNRSLVGLKSMCTWKSGRFRIIFCDVPQSNHVKTTAAFLAEYFGVTPREQG